MLARCRSVFFSIPLLFALGAAPSFAQTVQLNNANATTIRGGAYAATNYRSQTILETRSSDDPSYERRAILKFDTQNTIPSGAAVISAVLTLTVAGGNSETRNIGAYRLSSSYDESYATWNNRKSSTSWTAPGGDSAERFSVAPAANAAGSRITFDITDLVRRNVSGVYGSNRYTRVELMDTGGASRGSYKQFYSDEAGDATVRPLLTVVLGSATAATTTATTSSTSTSSTGVRLRVLQWNLHHGVGTDGRYDIDRIATWMAKMTPDVVMVNEVEKYTGWGNENQPARYQSLLQSKTGRTWYKLFAQEFGAWSSNGKGSLILSTYPIESYDRTTLSYSRVISDAHITVNGRTVSLLITHLDPYSQTYRLVQAQQAVNWASGHAENRILTGDMNAWPDQSSIAEYDKTYKDSWTVAESKGTAYQFSGLSPDGATKKGRIDYIFYSKYASNLVVLSSKVYDTRDANGYMPSDHRPVVTTFEVR